MDKILSCEEISAIVSRLAGELRRAYGFTNALSRDLANEEPLIVISILNGAFVFTADLVRATGMPIELDFMRCASYGMRSTPAEKVSILRDISVDIRGREVLIVEDIVDRGVTLKAVKDSLGARGPKEIKVCSFLQRSGGVGKISVDFVGKYIDDGFVVGYGMDYKERYRELPELYILPAGDLL